MLICAATIKVTKAYTLITIVYIYSDMAKAYLYSLKHHYEYI